MTAFDDELQQRLYQAVEKTLAARAARRAERLEFQTRRAFGLEARHAEKLRRIHQEDAMPMPPPCCEGIEGGCPQHRQAATVTRYQGLRNRSAGGSRVIGEQGTAKPAPEPKEQP